MKAHAECYDTSAVTFTAKVMFSSEVWLWGRITERKPSLNPRLHISYEEREIIRSASWAYSSALAELPVSSIRHLRDISMTYSPPFSLL